MGSNPAWEYPQRLASLRCGRPARVESEGAAMKLYHFTLTDHLRSIMHIGIRAMPLRVGGQDYEGIPARRGVWLTELDNTLMPAQVSAENFKLTGKWYRHWMHYQ